jgi:Cys-rich four helix bundle protein (predicted Tat secretion target)
MPTFPTSPQYRLVRFGGARYCSFPLRGSPLHVRVIDALHSFALGRREHMDRRSLLAGLGTVMSAAVADTALGATAKASATSEPRGGGARGALAAAAADCNLKSQACLDHCLVMLGHGDQTLAECANLTIQVQAICSSLQRLASGNSKYLTQMAQLAKQACRDCAAECRKHADNHETCKACMLSCEACADECAKVVG